MNSSPKSYLTDNDQLKIKTRLDKKLPHVTELYQILEHQLERFAKSEAYVTEPYIGYRYIGQKRKHLFVEIHLKKDIINLHLRNIEYKNTNLTISTAPPSHNWTLIKMIDFHDEGEIDNIMNLISQSYNDVCEE